jgi:hypothetical protein
MLAGLCGYAVTELFDRLLKGVIPGPPDFLEESIDCPPRSVSASPPGISRERRSTRTETPEAVDRLAGSVTPPRACAMRTRTDAGVIDEALEED